MSVRDRRGRWKPALVVQGGEVLVVRVNRVLSDSDILQ